MRWRMVAGALCGAAIAATVRADTIDYSRPVGYIALDMEREFGADLEDYARLERILLKAYDRIPRRQTYSQEQKKAVLQGIHGILVEEGYRYEPVRYLSECFETEEALTCDCSGMSLIYLTIGEMLGLPLRGVHSPRHIFIRWEGDTPLNWEPTTGVSIPDKIYIGTHHIHPGAVNEAYLRALTKEEVLGTVYNHIGIGRQKKRDLDGAIAAYRMGVALTPKNPLVRSNLGHALRKKGALEEALAQYMIAIDLDPNYHSAYLGRAWVRKRTGDREGAHEDFSRYKALKKK